MKTPKKIKKESDVIGSDFFERLWAEGWTYIKTVVDVVREPVLILNKDLCVMAANEPFYRMFRVDEKDTEGKVVYKLGNGQWNIPALRKLLESILPKDTFFKGFEVAHDFPIIGRKIMTLNARQIHVSKDSNLKVPSLIILLAIEDLTEMMQVAKTIAGHAHELETKLAERTQKLEIYIEKLERKINDFRRKQ